MVDKLILFSLFVFIAILVIFINNRSMVSGTYTLLALGDSYTIGEGVALYESFPYQAIQQLRKAGHNFNAPEIIARTGWTTDDLKKGIRNTMFQTSYHFVSLLIGVNDQYTNKNIQEYAANFELLLKQSIAFAANNPSHVFVLSIPNWSDTPFAAGRDQVQIASDIHAFNTINEKISRLYKVRYLSVSERDKEAPVDLTFLAPDLLHPSKKNTRDGQTNFLKKFKSYWYDKRRHTIKQERNFFRKHGPFYRAVLCAFAGHFLISNRKHTGK